jgi:hypothetical protein
VGPGLLDVLILLEFNLDLPVASEYFFAPTLALGPPVDPLALLGDVCYKKLVTVCY